jgi:hypothetical protein
MKKVLSAAPLVGSRRHIVRVTRLGLAVSLLAGLTLSTVTALLGSTPAGAATTYQCIDPVAAGNATNFIEGTVSTYTVECEGASGISGTPAYPSAINIASGGLPVDANQTFATTTASSPACTTSTSGSGTTEQYILLCAFSATPTSSDAGTYPLTFTASPGTAGGSAVTSGTLTITVKQATTSSCIDPVTAGSATNFIEGTVSTYTVECETQSGISGTSAFPASIAIASGALPGDANQTFATSKASSPACVTGTSGSGATEFYILECALSATPTSTDGGTYPLTFQASTVGSAVSGALTITVKQATTSSCIDPATAGSSVNFFEGSANSYTVECETQSGVSGTSAFPASLAIASGALPGDANQAFATSTSSSPACVTGTSGSGATEFYILECALSATPSASDGGAYPFTFQASTVGSAVSGTLTVNVIPPSTTCTSPAAAGTSTTFTVGTASTFTVTCSSSGFSAASPGNYPASITINSGSLPADASMPNTVGGGCTQSTTGTGTATQYQLNCKVSETPTPSDEGTYTVTFLATGGANGAPNAVSGTWTLSVKPPAPTFPSNQYTNAETGQPFCYDAQAAGVTTANGGLPLTSITLGATPAGVTGYNLSQVNLAAGYALACGTETSASGNSSTISVTFTNSGGSATASVPLYTYGQCTWTSSTGTVSMFDAAQDEETNGSQSAFGQPISNGETMGVTKNAPTCSNAAFTAPSLSGGAFTINTANPLPTPVDTNPSAAQGDLASSNLDLTSASMGTQGGCYGDAVIDLFGGKETYNFGNASSQITLPSTWVNGGVCSYGSLGSNSAGGNTSPDASCPPTQTDVNAGYVDCTIIASSGNDNNASYNNSTMELFFNGQPVPQQSTATLSSGSANAGGTVSVTGGTNWWGSSGGAPNTGPYGDDQGVGNMYQVGAPGVFIGATRGTAVPVVSSTVTISANSYVCTGAESATVGPNPCTLTPGQPSGTFQVPPGLAAGTYNVYVDETDTTPLPGNGPNDAYQTARGTHLGTAESVTQLVVGPPVFNSAATTTFAENDGSYNVSATGYGPVSLSMSGAPAWLSLTDQGTGSGTGSQTDTAVLSGIPPFGTAANSPFIFTITATDGNGNTTNQTFTLVVNPSAPAFTSAPGTQFFENAPGSFLVTADGDVPVTFSETGALPSGVTFQSDGTLAGTPAFGTAAGSPYNLNITATDGNGNTSTQAFALAVGTAAGPAFTSGNSTTFTENSAGSFSVSAQGDGPVSLSESGALPSGVMFVDQGTGSGSGSQTDTGLLEGTPAFETAGTYDISLTATDGNGNSTTVGFTLTVLDGNPVITSANSTSFTENSAGSFSVTANGDAPLTFSTSDPLPTGVTLQSNGTLSGTPAFTTAGTYPLTITVTDGNSNTGTQAFTLTVNSGDPVFTSATTTTFSEGVAGSFNVTANGDPPLSFTETGALPTGVTLATSGTLSGTPIKPGGTFPITITATDPHGDTSTQGFVLYVIAPGALHIITTSLPGGSDGVNYSARLQAGGGTTPYHWSLVAGQGALPHGLHLSKASGKIHGKPTAHAGTYTFTVQVRDKSHPTETATGTLSITIS